MIEKFNEHKIHYVQLHFKDLDKFLNSNHEPVKVFFIMGSTRRILRDGIHPSIDRVLNMPAPVIGICYGFQYMAMRSGGTLEDGATRIKMLNMPGTIGNENIKMWVNHFDKVKSLPTSKSAKHKVVWMELFIWRTLINGWDSSFIRNIKKNNLKNSLCHLLDKLLLLYSIIFLPLDVKNKINHLLFYFPKLFCLK